jgi:hypothetical protein
VASRFSERAGAEEERGLIELGGAFFRVARALLPLLAGDDLATVVFLGGALRVEAFFALDFFGGVFLLEALAARLLGAFGFRAVFLAFPRVAPRVAGVFLAAGFFTDFFWAAASLGRLTC